MTGRPKHYYSVYQKMIVGGHDFADIYDLVALRVLVDSVRDCYAVLGALHARWNPVPGRFKDYIAMPKFNMYQSLHTTVIGPEGKPVEIQIRTHAMHRRAEYGVAAHWKYKDALSAKPASSRPASAGGGGGAAGGGESDMAWLRQLVDWQSETTDPGEFLESLRFEINAAEVFVFTPRGEVMGLPAGSTPVDFAYAVHTEVGHRAMGSRVNGRLVPLEHTLDNGDVVEIFTSRAEGAGPSQDWLAFVKSPRARTKIRAWFSKERREEAVEAGRDAIARAMRKQHLPLQRLMSHSSLAALAAQMRYADVSGLYAAVGEHVVSAQSVVERLVALLGGEVGAGEDLAEAVRPPTPSRLARAGESGVSRQGRRPTSWVEAGALLHPGARRRHRRLRHPGQGRLGAPGGLRERGRAARPPRAHRGGGLGGGGAQGRLPRAGPGRGPGPLGAALGRDQGDLRQPRQHPVRLGDHRARPRGHLPLHLRDGRPRAPGLRAGRRAQGRRGLRRLPHRRRQAVGVVFCRTVPHGQGQSSRVRGGGVHAHAGQSRSSTVSARPGAEASGEVKGAVRVKAYALGPCSRRCRTRCSASAVVG